MSKVKLLIEIEEPVYSWIKNAFSGDEEKRFLLETIANGKVITDDCISRNALKNEYAEKCAGECDCCLYNDHYDGCKLINNAPPIGGKDNDK